MTDVDFRHAVVAAHIDADDYYSDLSNYGGSFSETGGGWTMNETATDPYGGTDGVLDFNGSSFNYWAISTGRSNIGTSDCTIEIWLQPHQTEYEGVWGITYTSGSTAHRCMITISSSRIPQFTISDASTTQTITATTVVALNTWAHVRCVRRGLVTEIYVNGVLENTVTQSAILNVERNTYVLGKTYVSGDYAWFNGLLSDALFYNVAAPTGNFTIPTAKFTSYPLSWKKDKEQASYSRFMPRSVNQNVTMRRLGI